MKKRLNLKEKSHLKNIIDKTIILI